ncbi:ABC transporter permease [Herbidospora mongoliensis]|uniref:ABC transporter permease n=1 Tax=Herbidospora mongoliensis TaxID=688067 RepID=UPI000A8EB588|nr:ABC transporter permease [Herbidospora mongoliensis]
MNSFADSTTMLRRNFRHSVRNPVAIINALLLPLFLIFLMVYVLGDGFDLGVSYIDYATPGLIIMTICYGVSATTVAVNTDMTTGFINRLRVMDVSRAAVLNSHVIVTTLRSLLAIAVIIGIALLMGFAPAASFPEWLGAIGVIVLAVVAISWLTVAFGLAAKTPESAGIIAAPLMLLPFLSSAFVPAEKMGPGVSQFAEYQPFSSIIEALRGFLAGTPSTGAAVAAVAWCVGITLVSYVWARATFSKRV